MARRFKFRLESVLAERKRQEEKRLGEWTLARQLLQAMKDALSDLQKRLHEIIEDGGKLAALPTNSAANFQSVDTFIIGQRKRIEWKTAEIGRAEKLVEKKRLEYVAASQKRKALEKLKEKRLEEYVEFHRKKELKALDDIYVMRGMKQDQDEEGVAV